MICEIICVGTELLLGDIVNTDGAFLARELAAMGFASYHQTTVGDNGDRLREVVQTALSRADILILTGGLGPTCDDITKSVTAEVFGKPLRMNEDVRRGLEAFFRERGRVMTENNLSQAMIPEGAVIFDNRWGTAPGVAMEGEFDGEKKIAILLPGPPSECEPMFTYCVKPYLAKLSDTVLYSLNLHLTGIGESAAEQILRPIMESSVNPTVAPYAGESEVRIRITAMAESEEAGKVLCREMAEKIRRTEVGDSIYAETDDPAETKNAAVVTMLRLLRERGLTFGTAESCTAGMIASLVGDIPGASDVFLGGVVSYANEVKEGVLGVSHETLITVGAVSEECAAQMAQGARRTLGAGLTVAVTGIAGPGGGTDEKPVGTVCFAVADKNGCHTETVHFGARRDRMKIRRLTTAHAIMLAIRRMRGTV